MCPGATCWADAALWMADPRVEPADKNGLLRALVERSVQRRCRDARRVALALLMPGLVAELGRHRRRPAGRQVGVDDLEAEVMGIAWELISAYPLHRARKARTSVVVGQRVSVRVNLGGP